MGNLEISLLGTLAIAENGKPIEVVSNYARALLIFLVIEKQHPHRREALAELFWPEKPEGAARNSLKQALSNLRKALGDRENSDPFLLVSRDEIQFNQSSQYWVDALACTELIEACEEHSHTDFLVCKACEERLLRAIELYQGDFMHDFYLPENQEFNDWILLKQEVFRRQISEALCKLAQIYEARGEFTAASEYCRQLTDLEPWNEENHRNLIRLLALSGMRSAALRQYQICSDSLEKELGVEPSNATVALYEEIRTWEPDTFLDHASTPTSVESTNQAFLPAADDQSHPPLPARKLSKRSVVTLVVASIILGIGSISWLTTPKEANSQTSRAQITDSSSPLAIRDETETLEINPTQQVAQNPAEDSQPVEMGDPDITEETTPIASNSAISEPEIKALLAIYNQTDGPNWKNATGWLSESSPCEWHGVTCRGEKIVELDLSHNQLSGNIPAEIGILEDLERLNLSNNHLLGNLPPELGDLSNLEHLILSGNRELNGPIPPELGNLSHLVEMELAHWENGGSLISGAIPPEFGQLSELKFLRIGTSLLEGPLPRELFGLTNLTTLDLPNNRLSGPIPPEIGNLINLDFLDLGGNDFSGPLPSELGNLTMLYYFSVGDSLVSGEIPPELGNLVRLKYLVLDNTELFGPLPLTLLNLNLRELSYFGTKLCEPDDEAFQAWLETIRDLQGTNIRCATMDG